MGNKTKKILLTFFVCLSLALALLRPIDDLGDHSIDQAFKRALIGFAIARSLNGVISVAQGTEFAIQPAGVGINFTPGQILDPVNDLVENFSWIMLLSTTSLGIQKTFLVISGWTGLMILLACSSALFLLSLWWHKFFLLRRFRSFAAQLFIVILALRFIVPVVALGNEWVYQQFLASQHQHSSRQLEQARDHIGAINQQTKTQEQDKQTETSFVDKAKRWVTKATEKVDFEKKLDKYKAAAEDVSENTINLIVVFVLQTIVFPLAFLWVLSSLLKRAMSFF